MSSATFIVSSSNSPTESLDGLKFGQKIYFEDGTLAAAATTTTTTQARMASSSSSAAKKGRNGAGGGASAAAATQPPRCQVEGCKVDLSDAKAYYSRHKVCGMHSKSPTVVVAGMEQRFCQQCSRFHLLPEFDQGKRSCRRRLAGHNERRRKPPPSSILSSRYAKLSSPIYDFSGKGSGFLMEFSSYPKLTGKNQLLTLKSSQPVSEKQTSTLTWQANSDTPSDFFLQGSVGTISFPAPRHPPLVENYTGVANSSCALSLLSSQTWGPRNMEPSVELNNLLNFNGTPSMTQLSASSHVTAMHQLPNTSWCFKDIDCSNCVNETVADIGLGHNAQTLLHSDVLGELDGSQQGRRHYMDLGLSREYESPQWSL